MALALNSSFTLLLSYGSNYIALFSCKFKEWALCDSWVSMWMLFNAVNLSVMKFFACSTALDKNSVMEPLQVAVGGQIILGALGNFYISLELNKLQYHICFWTCWDAISGDLLTLHWIQAFSFCRLVANGFTVSGK